jgi:hypothetical protein
MGKMWPIRPVSKRSLPKNAGRKASQITKLPVPFPVFNNGLFAIKNGPIMMELVLICQSFSIERLF